MRMDNLALFVFITICLVGLTTSTDNFFNCKSISVSGIVVRPDMNGVYDKVFNCNQRSVYRLQGSDNNKPIHLFWRNDHNYWAIGQAPSLGDCDVLTSNPMVIAIDIKLWPHLVEATWQEYIAGKFYPKPGITVDCDDVYWSMGCSGIGIDFPINRSRCDNDTSAIDVQAVYVVNFKPGDSKIKNIPDCASADHLCAYGDCGLETLECKKNLSKDAYEYKLVHSHCHGRHIQCRPFSIEALFHINCETDIVLSCDEAADQLDGILLEYKCKRSKKYIGPNAPAEFTGSKTKQISACTSTSNPGLAPSGDSNKQTDSTLINIVAPAAGGLFFVIILAVVIATLRKRLNRNKSRKEPDNNTYANITSLGANPSSPIKKRPDISDNNKKLKRIQANKDISPHVKPAVDAFIDANPNITGADGTKDGMFTVFILDPDDGTQMSRQSNGQTPRAGLPSFTPRQQVKPEPPPARSPSLGRAPGVLPTVWRSASVQSSVGRTSGVQSPVVVGRHPAATSVNNDIRSQVQISKQPDSRRPNGRNPGKGSTKPNHKNAGNHTDKKSNKKQSKKDNNQKGTRGSQVTTNEGHLPPVGSLSKSNISYKNRAYTT